MPYHLVISANRIRGQWFSFSKADVRHLCCCMCTAGNSVGLALYVYKGRQWMICVPRLGLSHIFPNLENTARVSMLYARTGIGLFVPCLQNSVQMHKHCACSFTGFGILQGMLPMGPMFTDITYSTITCQYQQACNGNTTLISNWRNSGHKHLLVMWYYVFWNQDTPASEPQIM